MEIILSHQDITQQKEEYIDMLRAFSVSKREQWRKVPHLALQADGRTGYNEALCTAYRQGFWKIESSISSSHYTVYVDCFTGELVSPFSIDERELKPAHDSKVLQLKIEEINADFVINQLEKWAQEEYPSYYNKEDQDIRREEVRKRFCVKPYFRR